MLKNGVTSKEISSQANEEGLFEGCGREGPIRAIFLSEFHHTVGPKIVYQYPPDTISKEIFDAISTYIIPKTHLQRLILTVNALGKKVIGCPIQIENESYIRNAYYFNVCFVCDAWARTVQYEQVLVKFAQFFDSMEQESQFLSKQSKDQNTEIESKLEQIFKAVLQGLNGPLRESSIVVGENSRRLLKLKVVQAVLDDPPLVESYHVPVFVTDVNPIDKWDLTTQQLIPYVDGFNHIAKIGHLAEVDTSLVKVCLQNLLYYRVIKLTPIFQYSNTYCTTPKIQEKLIMGTDAFKNECIEFVARSEHNKPHFADIVRFYCAMKRGGTIKDLCCRFRTVPATPPPTHPLPSISDSGKYSDHSLSSSTHSNQSPRTFSNPTTPVKFKPAHSQFYNARLHSESQASTVLSLIDERYLVLFGIVHGFVRRIEKFPCLQLGHQRHSSFSMSTGISTSKITNSADDGKDIIMRHRQKYSSAYDMFNGNHTFDEICLATDLTQADLDDVIEKDPDVVVVWK